MDKFALFVNNPLDFVTTMISYGEMHESMSSSQKKNTQKELTRQYFIISGLPNKVRQKITKKSYKYFTFFFTLKFSTYRQIEVDFST